MATEVSSKDYRLTLELPKHDHAFQDPEGERPDILVWNEASVRKYAELAYLQGMLHALPDETSPLLSEAQANAIATDVVERVCELPDYNSPDDQPELVQATVTQLHNCVMLSLEAFTVNGKPQS